MEDDTIGDRVFVCVGKAKGTEQRAVWIMTLNKLFDEATFWEVNTPKKYKLTGRIQKNED